MDFSHIFVKMVKKEMEMEVAFEWYKREFFPSALFCATLKMNGKIYKSHHDEWKNEKELRELI